MARTECKLFATMFLVLAAGQQPVTALEMPAFPDLSGDAARGQALVVDRRKSFCLLCHSVVLPANTLAQERFMGDLAPSLNGAGSRWSNDALRARLIDSRQLNPDTIMPSYYRTDGVGRVGRVFEGKTILTAQEIEDIVAFLASLKE